MEDNIILYTTEKGLENINKAIEEVMKDSKLKITYDRFNNMTIKTENSEITGGIGFTKMFHDAMKNSIIKKIICYNLKIKDIMMLE